MPVKNSEKVFNHNMNRIKELRNLKGNGTLFCIMDSKLPRFGRTPLFMSEDGKSFTNDLLKAYRTHSEQDAFNKANKTQLFVELTDYDIETIVKDIMNENMTNMDHITHHETEED